MPTFDAKLVIFDLDGTLLDSSHYAAKAIHQAFGNLIVDHPELSVPSVEAITGQIGKPMQEFYRGLLPPAKQGLWSELHQHAAAIEKSFLKGNQDFLFRGTRECLDALKAKRKVLAIASNCSWDYINAIAEAYQFKRWFDELQCIGEGRDTTKAQLVEDLVEKFAPDGCAIMIGDRIHDQEAARVSGIPFVGCRYGFAAANEWEGA
ncbi:MAG: HAD family hydrolase, partial [Planctomycetes bacterium]|nr:HAD family hydrolase [Planctomycetota bacterium]